MKYIKKASENIDGYPFLNNVVFDSVFMYKLCKYDAIGAIECEQWSVVDCACKEMLTYGMQGFLATKGYCTHNLEMAALLKTTLQFFDDNIVAIIEKIIYRSVETDAEIYELYKLCVDMVENLLIPTEFWDFLGKDGLIVWENWMDILYKLKKLELELDCNFTTTGPMSLEQLGSWIRLTNNVFRND